MYKLATQRPKLDKKDVKEELYKRYKQVYTNYLEGQVLPRLRDRGGAFMLAEIGKCWSNHRDVMVKWMKKFFMCASIAY